jgi:5'-nucleotidase
MRCIISFALGPHPQRLPRLAHARRADSIIWLKPNVLAILLAAIVVLSPSAQTYRILVTNDDGIRAPGILALARALTTLGEVTVVAPSDNQSGKGHSLTLLEPIFVDKVTLEGIPTAYAVTATPASCVKVALAALMTEKPNLVVSGINRGQNLGRVAYVSGTVGAAREAALQGIPGIAVSLKIAEGTTDVSYAAAAAASRQIAEFVKTSGLPPAVFLNVNVPPGAPDAIKGLRLAMQSPQGGTERFMEHQRPPSNRRYFWNVYEEPKGGVETDDVGVVEQGYVAVVPLRASEFDRDAFNQLGKIIR